METGADGAPAMPTAAGQAGAVQSTEKLLADPALQQLGQLYSDHGFEIRLVGGAVRDLLRGVVPSDLDLATTATPAQSQQLLAMAQIKVIETGLQHGTITAVIDHVPYEITTLRIDTDTDGRRCTAVFTTDWQVDAERRDLTINAMSMDLTGAVYDYFEGREHLAQQQVRFVGDPRQRITEDYLRILRYFRFHARISRSADFDPVCLEAISQTAAGLQGISGERIRSEMVKTLATDMAVTELEAMILTTTAKEIGLEPTETMVLEFKRVVGLTTNPITRLATLVDTEEDWLQLFARWKLTNEERDDGLALVKWRVEAVPLGLEQYQDLLVDKVRPALVFELARYRGQLEIVEQLAAWPIPVFPVTGKMLKQAGMKPGPGMGVALKAIREVWRASRFTATVEALLQGAQPRG